MPEVVESPVRTGAFSPGVVKMGEILNKAIADGHKAAGTAIVPGATPAPETAAKETPKEPDKAKATPTPDKTDKPVVPDIATTPVHRTADDWKTAKDEAYKRGRTDFEKEVRENYVPKAEFDALTKDLQEYRKRLQTTALERDPQFQRQFEGMRRAALTMAKEALVGTDMAGQVETILSAPPSQWRDEALDKVFDGLSPAKSARLSGAIAAWEKADQERQMQLENAGQIVRQRAEQTKAQIENQTRSIKEAFASEMALASDPDSGLEVLREKPGDDTWNSRIAEIRKLAEHIYSGVSDPRETARASIQAALYKPLLESSLQDKATIKELQDELAKYKNSTPNPAEEARGKANGGGLPKPGEGAAWIASRVAAARHRG